MKYNRLGNSELLVSEIGIGGMSLPSDAVGNSKAIIHQAFDYGVNFFDTADLYDRGANEVLLGKALQGLRDKVILATKVGNQWQEGVEGWRWNPSRVYILQAIEQSLKRLNTDYIDLYQLHGGTNADNFDEIVETFELLVQQGKIRYYGISSIRPNVFRKYLQQSGIVSNMMQYSILDTRPEESFRDFEEKGVSIIARGSMAQGLLLNKVPAKSYLDHTVGDIQEVKAFVDVASKKLGISRQAVALKYCLDKPVVSSALAGIRTLEQLEQLLHSHAELAGIADERVESYFSSLPKLVYKEHR